MKLDIRVVVIAGGSGTRFWPLSRADRPKQFLPVTGRKSMLEETVERLRPLVPPRNLYTVADAAKTKTIVRLLPRLRLRNLLVEPEGRNTAPSLVLATARIHAENPAAVVVVLPSDHLIRDVPVFLRQLEAGCRAADERRALVTFGIPPTFPSTGYGYIRASVKTAGRIGEFPFHDVVSFEEKPPLHKARKFARAKNYTWNSGMFIWRADVFAEKLKKHAPEYARGWDRMLAAFRGNRKRAAAAVFKTLPAKSIDYALMEKASGVLVFPARFGWSDVGAWSSLFDVWPRDSQGNAARGEVLALESEGNLVYNPGRLTALIGVENLIVVETEDALLVCRRDADQKVKDVLAELKRLKKTKYL
ncbi:MAG: mannose-1-phosphate guanylyltransferase [Candidatus Aminicenantes bacterium]|nr:mannose-1-phosphate guanylyltransferase [Candidatus Aminicenantes bacterium]